MLWGKEQEASGSDLERVKEAKEEGATSSWWLAGASLVLLATNRTTIPLLSRDREGLRGSWVSE